MVTSNGPYFSVVIPLYNEAESLQALVDEITPVMDRLGAWNLIAVDDGSTDQTRERLKELAKNAHPRVIPLALDRNHGQSAALAAGFQHARGEIIITLDGDGQNDPADIPRLVEALQHCDLVCGYRRQRQDPWWRLPVSRLANAVRRRVCADGVHDTGCGLKAFRRACLTPIKLFNGMHRFLPALFQIEGYRVQELPVEHRPRAAGRSKYPFYRRLVRPVVDLCAVAWLRKRHLNYRSESLLR